MPSATNANQYLVQSHKKEPVPQPFLIINQNDLWNAFKAIKEECPRGSMSALGLWLYLAQNSSQKGYWELSPKAFSTLTSYSHNNFYKAREVLENIGYLKKGEQRNQFDFYTNLNEFDLDELTFADAIQLDRIQMAKLYYILQDLPTEEISDDMAEFYDFYQERISGEV